MSSLISSVTFVEEAPQEKPAAKPGPERRAGGNRLELHAEVTFESDHNFYTGLTQDVSHGGLFLATRYLRRVGEHLQVTFTLPGILEPFQAEAEVRWVRDRSTDVALPMGMGMRFLNLSRDAQARIAAFVRQRDSLFFDDEP
jgi:uncharacterized protein (TIGR02266 family)